VPCRSSCQDPRHDTTLAFVSCWHGPKIIVSCRASVVPNCRASGRAKMSCFVQPINSTAQVPALALSSPSSHPRKPRVSVGRSRRQQADLRRLDNSRGRCRARGTTSTSDPNAGEARPPGPKRRPGARDAASSSPDRGSFIFSYQI
jgi:hypothetical protein